MDCPRSGPPARRILPGAKELTFEYEGWRIHCALLLATDGREYIVREEYWKISNSKARKAGSLSIKEFELDAILKGEAGSGSWTPKILGDTGKDMASTLGNQIAHVSGLTGKVWVREDGAIARVPFGAVMISLDLPQARKYEAELKAIQERKVRAAVPKF